MNTNKAQKEVFNALLLGKGCTSGFFLENNENNPMFVTTNGYVGYIFQPESIMFNVEKIRRIKSIEMKEIICSENKLEPTDDFRVVNRFKNQFAQRLKNKNYNVFVNTVYLKNFQNPSFYQKKGCPESHIVVTENLSATKTDYPVGIVCPIRIDIPIEYYNDKQVVAAKEEKKNDM